MKKESNEKETPFQKAHEQFDVQTMIKNVLNQRFQFCIRYTVRQFTLNRQKPPPSRCQVPVTDRLTAACRGRRISTCWFLIHVSGRFSSFAWLCFHGEQPFAQGIYPWDFFFACTKRSCQKDWILTAVVSMKPGDSLTVSLSPSVKLKLYFCQWL